MTKIKTNKIGQLFLNFLRILVILFLLGIIFTIIRSIYLRVQDERNVSRGIEALKSEVQELDQNNKDLNKLIDYFNSTEFQEKEIKEKLNLVKEGEKVIIVQGNKNTLIEKPLDDNINQENVKTIHDNYYYWWKYFFGK